MNNVYCLRQADTTIFYALFFSTLSLASLLCYFFVDLSDIIFNVPTNYNQTVEMIESATGGIATFAQYEFNEQKNLEVSLIVQFIDVKKTYGKISFNADFSVNFLHQGSIVKKMKLKVKEIEFNQTCVLFNKYKIKFDAITINVDCKGISDPSVVFKSNVMMNSDPYETKQIIIHSIFAVSNGIILVVFFTVWDQEFFMVRNPLILICLCLLTHLCGVKTIIIDEIFETTINHLFRTTCHFLSISNRSFGFFMLLFMEFFLNCYSDLVTPVLKANIYAFVCYAWMVIELIYVAVKQKNYTEIFVFFILTINEVIASVIQGAENPNNWFALPIFITNLFASFYVGISLDMLNTYYEVIY